LQGLSVDPLPATQPSGIPTVIMTINSAQPRTIVITGGGAGIGRATALICAARGDSIAVLDKDADAAKSTAVEALARGAKHALGLPCDVTVEKQVEESFQNITAQLGAPYGIFANAGIDQGGLIHELPLETWRLIIDTNLTGIFLSCKHGIRQMIKAGMSGSIVCTSSPTGFVALAAGGAGAYSATKGGVSSLIRCMAVDYAHCGIRVNAVVPGSTETSLMWNNVSPADIARMRQQLSKEIPLGRLAQPEDPARAVAWLLSEESSYVTGSHLVCDGGSLAKASFSV
jgi:NAD(P)-dependent dehydrogenase (short-subunit alcohol dehydrogenase family)